MPNLTAICTEKLKGSRFEGDLDHIVGCFDKTAKLRFKGPGSNDSEAVFIKFGTTRDKDAALNIRSGQMKLAGSVVLLIYSLMSPDGV